MIAIVLTYNEEEHITACIESIPWEVLVFDSYSTDATVELAREAGAQVIQHEFADYGSQRNAALEAVAAAWVLFVDADERVTPALAAEIKGVLGRPERGWWVPRHNYIFGRLTRGAGWYPDYQMRLLHRESARYNPDRPVHEEVILQGEAGHLEQPLIHYNYATVEQFHRKQKRYATFEAQRRAAEGMQPKLWTYITGPLRHFWWRFVTLEGHREGLHGLRLSLWMAWYEFVVWRQV